MEQFDIVWQAYPKRGGKKVGKQAACKQWAKIKPNAKIVTDMLKWLRIDKANRQKQLGVGTFYAPLKDMHRWLRGREWKDPIDDLTRKPKPKPIVEHPEIKRLTLEQKQALGAKLRRSIKSVGSAPTELELQDRRYAQLQKLKKAGE